MSIWVKNKSTVTNDRFRNYGNTHRSQGCRPGLQGRLIFCKHKDASYLSESYKFLQKMVELQREHEMLQKITSGQKWQRKESINL